jgi:sulfur carrier protein
MVELQVNGELKTIPPNTSAQGLLDLFNIQKETVVVEHNLKILKKEELPQALLMSGDTIEIIRFVGGG